MQNVSASSILPVAFAFHPRTFHEHCNIDSLSGGFSKGITGSILTSCPTSQESGHLPQGVLRLNWRELLFGEAERIMPHDADVVSIKLGHIGCAEIAAAAASCCNADSNPHHPKGRANCSLQDLLPPRQSVASTHANSMTENESARHKSRRARS